MKKIFLILLFIFSVVSFNHTLYAQIGRSKPYLSKVKQILAWPTDVLVENYSRQAITVRFITIVSDHTVLVNPYPAKNYFAQLLDQYNVYQVRVMIWDYYGRLFYDRNVGNVSRITLSPSGLNETLSAKDVTVF